MQGESVNAVGQEPTRARKHPSPALELTSNEGELCPTDTVGFSANSGAFTLTTSTESSGTQRCQLHIQVTVPAGYSFKRPVISSSGYALREPESSPPTQLAISYKLDELSITSHHEVPAAGLADEDTGSYVLTDTPELELPACNDPEEPEVFDLQLDIEAVIPEGTTFRLVAIDGEFDFGVPWFECPAQKPKEKR